MVMDIIWTATPEALVSSDMGGNFPNKTFAPANTPRETSSNYGPFNNIRHQATQQDKELPEIFTFVENFYRIMIKIEILARTYIHTH